MRRSLGLPTSSPTRTFPIPYAVGSAGATVTGYTIPGSKGGTKDTEYSRQRPASERGDYVYRNQRVAGPSFANLTLGQFARPTETRVYADFPKVFMDKPLAAGKVGFHPDGTTIAYMDGHSKFITRYSVYTSGCDGVDWAWDNAGTCNTQKHPALRRLSHRFSFCGRSGSRGNKGTKPAFAG